MKYDSSAINLVFLALSSPLDAIIIGASKMEHLVSNLEACEEGPLDKRMSLVPMYQFVTVFVCVYVGVVEAFDKAWMLDKGNCPKYYR